MFSVTLCSLYGHAFTSDSRASSLTVAAIGDNVPAIMRTYQVPVIPVPRTPSFCRLALAALVAAIVFGAASPALADGPRAAATRKKTLIESIHFGSYYVPQVVAAGRNVIVFWRGPDQSGTQRTYAISKNGGKTFGEAKSIRIPVLFQLVAIAGDSAGNVYFAGTTGFANQIALVRSDSQIRNFTTGTIIDSDRNVVGIELAATPAGHLYLAYQTAFAVPLMGGGTTTAEQVNWSVSTDLGSSFAEFVKTNSRPTFESDSAPSMYAAVDGSVWLFRIQVATQERALTGDAYTGGLVLATRVDIPSDPVVIARSEIPAGAPSSVRGFVSADGQLCVSWAETSNASGSPVQSVFFTRTPIGTPSVAPTSPIARVGTPHVHHLARTTSGQVILLLHGAGLDSDEPEPNIIGLASLDDGATFGDISKITGYPPVTSLETATDGSKVYGTWTDTRIVRFANLVPKDPK